MQAKTKTLGENENAIADPNLLACRWFETASQLPFRNRCPGPVRLKVSALLSCEW